MVHTRITATYYCQDVAIHKSGEIVHSRWVATAETLMEFWHSQHGLEVELLRRLELIVTFRVFVESPMWSFIKVNDMWIEGPMHTLTELT